MIGERTDGKMEAEMLTNQNVCRRKHPNSYTMNKKKTLKIVMAPMHQHVHFLTANQHAAGNTLKFGFHSRPYEGQHFTKLLIHRQSTYLISLENWISEF